MVNLSSPSSQIASMQSLDKEVFPSSDENPFLISPCVQFTFQELHMN